MIKILQYFLVLLFLVYNYDCYSQRFKSLTVSETTNRSKPVMQPLKYLSNFDINSFSIFDSVANNSNIFFIGENHLYRSSNSSLQIAMIEYLTRHVGLKHIVMEFGFARGWLVNHYINSVSGQYEEVLKLYTFPEYFEFYKNLRKFNLSLPDSLRLSVMGIDVERFHDTPIKALSVLLPNKIAPDSIALSIESLQGMASYLDNYFLSRKMDSTQNESPSKAPFSIERRMFNSRKTTMTLVDEFLKHENYYQTYLGDSCFPIYKRIILELRDNQTYMDYENQTFQHVYRERYMYSKFINYYSDFEGEKVFGQFGRCHVTNQKQDNPCSWYDFSSIVTRINQSESEFLNNKVCAIAFLYNDDVSYGKSIKENGKIADLISDAGNLDTIVAIQIFSDSTIYGDYGKYYNFIIVDRRDLEESSLDKLRRLEKIRNDFGAFIFYAGYKNSTIQMGALNSYIGNLGNTRFSDVSTFFMFGFQVVKNKGFSLGVNFSNKLHLNSISEIDTSGLNFSLSYFNLDFGWNIVNRKNVFISTHLGFGHSSHFLEYYQESSKLNPKLNVLGEVYSDVFKYNSFQFIPSIDLVVRRKILGLGYRIGYLFSSKSVNWSDALGREYLNLPILKHAGLIHQFSVFFIVNF